MAEKSNNSGALIGLAGLALLIASWFFVYVRLTLVDVVLWDWFLNFWKNDPQLDSLDAWAFLVQFLVPIVLVLIALPATLRSSFYQARIPMGIGGLVLVAAFIYRLIPIAENDLARHVLRFLSDTGLVTVGPGFFLNLLGMVLVLVSFARAKG